LGIRPKVLPENLIYFGVRGYGGRGGQQIDKLQIKNYKVDEVRYRGLQTALLRLLAKVAHCEVLYIS
jgi:arginase